jgi:hypothetical protein
MHDAWVVRKEVLDAIWGASGWPVANTASRTKTLVPSNPVDAGVLQANGIPTTGDLAGKMSTVDELAVTVTVDGISYQTRAYLLRPSMASNQRLVIVHAGHGPNFSDYGLGYPGGGGTGALAKFLGAGYSVLALLMPNYHLGSPFQPPDIDPNGDRHTTIFTGGGTSRLRVFLEPIAACLNWLRSNEAFLQFDMTGISGGGWTTVLYAAVEPSIRASVSASGSLPLDLRTSGDWGDKEQYYAPLFGGASTAGIAGYRDLYTIAAFGYGRRHIWSGNVFESGCCFSDGQYGTEIGAQLEATRASIQGRLANAGAGRFDVARFSDNNGAHTISPNGLDRIFTEINSNVPASSGLFLYDNAPPVSGQGALGGRGILKANGRYAFVGSDYGFSSTWSHVIATKNGNLFFYRTTPTVLAATARFTNDGTYRFVGEVPAPEPGAGWTHITAVNSQFVFFYKSEGGGVGKVARIDSNGAYSVVRSLTNLGTGWTSVTGLPNGGLFFLGPVSASPRIGRTARVDSAGNYTAGETIGGFDSNWSEVVGVNSNVLVFYAPAGLVGTSLLDAQGRYTYTGSTTAYVPYNVNLIAGAKNGGLFFLRGNRGTMFFVDEFGGVRYVQTLSGFNSWTAVTAN